MRWRRPELPDDLAKLSFFALLSGVTCYLCIHLDHRLRPHSYYDLEVQIQKLEESVKSLAERAPVQTVTVGYDRTPLVQAEIDRQRPKD